ncbi:MAG: hypothetical protein DME55_00295 [Verrucomicrobia bacterium]|nr:MAG: hypothetical protein DME55_00295 [Verrucomicrobiota bacterium]
MPDYPQDFADPGRFLPNFGPKILEKNDERKKHMKTITNIVYLAVAVFAFAWLALSPTAHAVTPAPDGGYPNANTAEGEDALFSLTSGIQNTGLGFHALYSNTTGENNTAVGDRALESSTTGNGNTAIGVVALQANTTGVSNTATGLNALVSNNTGNWNTATGAAALSSNTTGIDNTATGTEALAYNTVGDGNTAMGRFALWQNQTGNYNTASGSGALYSNTTGYENAAHGTDALYSNTIGVANTASGVRALNSNETGGFNTATGFESLFSNISGEINVATGGSALYTNTTGHRNTATGFQSMYFNTSGARNTATGFGALQENTTGNFNTACGWASLSGNTTGNDNTALGFGAGWNLTAGDNNIDVDNIGVAAESNTIRIGMQVETVSHGFVFPAHTATYIAGINGVTIPRGVGVLVDSNGRLGTKPSSQRFKDEIRPMDKASEAILRLKPVTFHYKKEIDAEHTPQFGLVAEDVEKVNPDLVVRDAEGKIYSVRYEAVNAMLLNEFLKEHRTVQEQQKEIDVLRGELKEERALIQKVNDKVELNRSAPQTVASGQR